MENGKVKMSSITKLSSINQPDQVELGKQLLIFPNSSRYNPHPQPIHCYQIDNDKIFLPFDFSNKFYKRNVNSIIYKNIWKNCNMC